MPGKSHGRRSLVGCSPCGHEELDTTERRHFPFSLSCIEEGNVNPLQCSCLENPRGGGAWWLPSMGLHRVGHDWSDLAATAAYTQFYVYVCLCVCVNMCVCVFVCAQFLSPVRLFVNPWTLSHQAPWWRRRTEAPPPLSMQFPGQEYWSGLPFPSPGDLPDPGIETRLLHWQGDSSPLSHLGSPCVCV